jgi:primosomal protein N' (replication factor Y) (superfamily II helicase)
MAQRQRYVSVSPLLVPVEKTFDYSVPDELRARVTIGTMVVVPFGKRRLFGMVVRISDIPPERKVRPVESVVDDFQTVPRDLLGLCLWISKMYLCPLNLVMEAAFPFQRKMSAHGIDRESFSSLRQRTFLEKNVALTEAGLKLAEAGDFEEFRRSPAQKRALRALYAEGGSLTARALATLSETSMSVIGELEKKGYVAIDYLPKKMSPEGDPGRIEDHFELNAVQKHAYETICGAMNPPRHEVFLLQGVTGSGKTEIYMHAVQCCIDNGRRALILVPEIALATQIIARFLRRFAGRIAVWHSSLSMTERLYEWNRITTGDVDIAIGARSAVFAPLENIGLIVVDEEHEASYKQESAPRYHARECAVYRAKLAGCPVVLGGATPALETIHQARSGRIKHLFLPHRTGRSELPQIDVVDMRTAPTERTTSLFSNTLAAAIAENLEKKEQIIVFLNHRGYAQYVQCHNCGHTLTCPQCSVTMKYHRLEKLMKCHICGWFMEVPPVCPSCEVHALRYFGLGTERVMNQLTRKFKAARIERMDRDTTSRKGEYHRIIHAFEEREIDILVGTQMVAKGLDFPGVTLVGVVSADSIINMPDFRSAERTFQLVTQVAGRAGRRDVPGRVIIQTLNPDHPAIRAAASQNANEFYDAELEIRKDALYPPFTYLINFIVAMEDENKGMRLADELGMRLQKQIETRPESLYFGLLGPAPAPLQMMHGKYRFFVLMRGNSMPDLLETARAAHDSFDPDTRRLIAVDVNPQSML